MIDLQPPIDFAEVSGQRAKTEHKRYARLAADFVYFRHEERRKEEQLNINLAGYVGKYVNAGLKMTLDIRLKTEKSLKMVVNNVASQHHELTPFPSSREEFVVRDFIDWLKWVQFIVSFHRHKESRKVDGVSWALQIGITPVHIKRVAIEE
ncbi:hypothetical protein BFJ69_g14732 [Fusarium oxysporum]|uniref:Uncharacterized protein n=1 Tax=Fusarium oxysporum TaxID=5507 RepID=A0A420MGP5_FUSOX|nr:hypothetical protein BFJ69_g14732 [Fusarium oxysporum]